jgi:hypothetical protein
VGYHGKPRFTGDIDFFLAVSERNAEAVMGALNKFGFGEIGLSAEDFLKPDFVVQLGYPPNRIDLVTGISGVGFAEAWAERIDGELDGVPVHFIGREPLIQNKRASGRPKDIEDVRVLEQPNVQGRAPRWRHF